ncbi:MAG: hypothetical protein AABZ32_01290 [Bacteroidota bacterium]
MLKIQFSVDNDAVTFDTLCKQTAYNKERQKSGGLLRTSWTTYLHTDRKKTKPLASHF